MTADPMTTGPASAAPTNVGTPTSVAPTNAGATGLQRGRSVARWLGRSVIVVLALIGAVVAIAFALTAADSLLSAGPGPTSTPGGPSPSPSLINMAPGAVAMPANADCKACHETSNGVIGVKDIPVIPHPVAAWSNCTACHDNARLVQTAPGHSGIHAEQCTVCHTSSKGPAPAPAHLAAPNARCLECHGKTAPLPPDMTHRPGNLCWLCHLSPTPSASPGLLVTPSASSESAPSLYPTPTIPS